MRPLRYFVINVELVANRDIVALDYDLLYKHFGFSWPISAALPYEKSVQRGTDARQSRNTKKYVQIRI